MSNANYEWQINDLSWSACIMLIILIGVIHIVSNKENIEAEALGVSFKLR